MLENLSIMLFSNAQKNILLCSKLCSKKPIMLDIYIIFSDGTGPVKSTAVVSESELSAMTDYE